MKRITRREAKAWLTPIRRSMREMRSGYVDTIRGYAVTRLHSEDDYARVDYAIAGFRALVERLKLDLDTNPLERLEKRLASGILLTVEQLDDALGVLNSVEDQLIKCGRQQVKDAVIAEQIAIEIEQLGLAA